LKSEKQFSYTSATQTHPVFRSRNYYLFTIKYEIISF